MSDPRVNKFSQSICKSLEVVEDDIVLIWSTEKAAPLILELQKEILQRGAYPLIRLSLEQMRYNFYQYAQEKHLESFPQGIAREIEIATKIISINCVVNPNQKKRIDQNKINQWRRTSEPYHRKLEFIPAAITIFPNVYYANQAGMSLAEYEELFYDAVSIDLEKLYEKYHPMERMLSRGNRFQLKTSNSDLSFELGDRHFTMHSLMLNFPDGEIFCAPLEDSVNGYIRFEHPQCYSGKVFNKLYLEFSNGKVVHYDCETDKSELEKLLRTDSGACKLGEFGIGINSAIKELTNDLLFDEKIKGTIHLALGDSYMEVGGTNRSVIHFDLVKDMRGDGELLVDGRVIYREGDFCAY